MGLSPRQIGQYPDRLVDLYAKVERDIISDMAKRIAEKDMFIPSAQWQFEKLQEMGMVQNEIVGRLSAVSGKSKDEIRRIITESGYKALNNDAKIYKRAGIDPTEALQSQSVKQALDNGLRMTNGEFENITRTTVNNATMQYFDALDSAYLQVSSGAFDHNTAIRNAIQKLTDNGIAVANYAGHNDYMETAVRRSILTGVNQAAAKGQEALADELDCDLVEVTAHSGARTGKGIANHAAWQGKIYSRSGKSTKYPSLVEKTGYGSGAGLCGWNCRHSFYPYIEGSERAYTDDELKTLNEPKYEYNGERLSEYEATQKQRYIERQIRKYKREVAGFESAGLDTANSKSKLRNWQDRQRDFIEQTGLKRDYEREGVFDSIKQKINIKSINNSNPLAMDTSRINNESYRLKYNGVAKSRKADSAVCRASKRAIELNSGTDFENLMIVDAKNGKTILNKRLSSYGGGFEMDFSIFKKNSLVLTHNHPNSTSFSYDDIITLNSIEEIKTIVAAGHDGSVYTLSIDSGKRLDFSDRIVYDDFIREWIDLYKHFDNDTHVTNLALCKKYQWRYKML